MLSCINHFHWYSLVTFIKGAFFFKIFFWEFLPIYCYCFFLEIGYPQELPLIQNYISIDHGANNQNWEITPSKEKNIYRKNIGGYYSMGFHIWFLHEYGIWICFQKRVIRLVTRTHLRILRFIIRILRSCFDNLQLDLEIGKRLLYLF